MTPILQASPVAESSRTTNQPEFDSTLFRGARLKLQRALAAGVDADHLQLQIDNFFHALILCAINSESAMLSPTDLADRILAACLADAPKVDDCPAIPVPNVLLARLIHGLNALLRAGVIGRHKRAGRDALDFGFGRIIVDDNRRNIHEDVRTTVENRRGILFDTHTERDAVVTNVAVTTTITYEQRTHRLRYPRRTRSVERMPSRVKRLLVSIPPCLADEIAFMIAPEFEARSTIQATESTTQYVSQTETRCRVENRLNETTLDMAGHVAVAAGAAALGALCLGVVAAPIIAVLSFAATIDPALTLGPFTLTGWTPDEV